MNFYQGVFFFNMVFGYTRKNLEIIELYTRAYRTNHEAIARSASGSNKDAAQNEQTKSSKSTFANKVMSLL